MLQNVLRKYPAMIVTFEEFLIKISFDSLTEPESQACYTWILGEYGSTIPLAPYILERMAKHTEETRDPRVERAILVAMVKLFFSRAPEVKTMLGQFFKRVQSSTDVSLKDNLYYTLLKTDPEKCRQIVMGEGAKVEEFVEDEEDLLVKKTERFNTLSVIYGQPQEKFLREDVVKVIRKAERAKQ